MPTRHPSARTRRSSAAHATLEPLEPRVHLDASTVFQFPQLDVVSEEVDLDGDGDLDLLARSGPRIGFAFNDGTGQFGPAIYRAFAGQVADIAVADLDDDGDADLAITAGSRLVRVYNDDIAAPFTRRSITQLQSEAASLTIGKFNGDAIPDIAVLTARPRTGNVQAYDLQIIFQRAGGPVELGPSTFAGPRGELSTTQSIPSSTKNEIRLTTFDRGYDFFMTARRVIGGGSGFPNNVVTDPARTADFDGDGDLDYLGVSNYAEAAVLSAYLQNGPGSYVRSTIAVFVDATIHALGTADLTGDGRPDIVLARSNLADTAQGDFGLRILVLAASQSGAGYEPERLLAAVAVPDGLFGFSDLRFIGFVDTNSDGTLDPLVQTSIEQAFGRSYFKQAEILAIESAPSGPSTPRALYSTDATQYYSPPPLSVRARINPTLVLDESGAPTPVLIIDQFVGENGGNQSQTLILPLVT